MTSDNILNPLSSSHTFNSIIEHNKNLLNSLKCELQYANLELNLINYLFSLNSPYGTDDEATESELFKNHNFLKLGSNDFTQTKDKWTNLLNESFSEIKNSLSNKNDNSKFHSQVAEAEKTITALQNSYFSSVQQRENNMKLLLRMKMHTNSRLKLLEDSLTNYESVTEFKPLYEEPKTKLVEPNVNTALSHMIDKEYKRVINANINSDIYTSLFNKKPEKSTRLKNLNLTPVPVFKSPHSSKLMNIFNLTNSLEEFKTSAKNIYLKYGTNSMSFNVFNNVVLFLVQSLHLPNLYRLPTEHIYSVYNVNPSSILDFRTFMLLYWEVIHSLRTAIELYYHPRYTFRSIHMYLNYSVDDYHPFVNISDHYSFIKRLSPGRSCNKYVVKELKTNELRVVELIFKTPDLPLFHEIYSEFEDLSRFDHKNLVKYVGLHHDYNTVYLVTEFCPELSLLNKLNTLDSSNFDYSLGFVHNVFTQLIEALVYLHCNNITHQCLHMSKIMLDDSSATPKIKLRDYGFYDVFDNYRHKSALTTLNEAPEVLHGTMTQKSNVWTAGMILLFMVTGHLPTNVSNKNSFVDNLSSLLLNSTIFKVEDDLYDLITYILCVDPNLRPSSFDIVSHSWFNSTNVCSDATNIRYLVNNLHEVTNMNNYRNISKFLESSNCFYVNKLNKLTNTLMLSSEPNQPEMVGYGNVLKVLKIANVPNNVISDFVQLTSLKDSDKCSLKEFYLGSKYWRFGELNILWSVCRKSINETDWSFDRNKFVEFLSESKTSLLPKEEINGVCRSIEVNDKIYWNNFVNLFL